jgi:hypothetical protein
MHTRHIACLLSIVAITAASAGLEAQDDGQGCVTMNTERLPLAQRASPLDSVMFRIDDQVVKICYGRPSSRGRTMIGGADVPYGQLWRTGANEPTMIHTPVALVVAGVTVAPGTYSLYTIPGAGSWIVILNRSTSQWGREDGYTEDVRAQEVGRGAASSETLNRHVERLTIRVRPIASDRAMLYLEWERTQVVIAVMKG